MSSSQPYNDSHGRQTGFTLIELMISLVLGLIVSAAVIQVYLINVKTSSIQSSASELQDASVFGLQQLEKKVRMANLGNPDTQIDDSKANGGIVLTGANLGITPYPNTGYLTRRAGDAPVDTNGWSGISNIKDVPSDQLTIQYTNVTGAVIRDCEGAEAGVNETIIERYFLRQATGDTSAGAIKNLVLACNAGRVIKANGTQGATVSSTFGQAGQELIVNADQFKVLLGVQYSKGANAGQTMYLPSSAYVAMGTDKPAIVSIKMGLIAHGTTPVLGSQEKTTFTLLGQDNVLKTDTSNRKQVRTSYETTTLLRNARVVSVSTRL